MLLHSNKKSLDTPKPIKWQRPTPLLSAIKIKTRLPDQSPNIRDRFKRGEFNTLKPQCAGIKLNSRELKSPQKKRKILSKIYRTDTITKQNLLSKFQIHLSYSTSYLKDHFFPKTQLFLENPQQTIPQNKQMIPSNHLLTFHQTKYVEIKEKIAFYLPTHKYAGLNVCKEYRAIPKMEGLIQSWGICLLGQQNKQFIVSELYFGLSFRNLMSEFEKCEECTARHFIKQLVQIISNLHIKGYSHNRLNLDSIVHNCQGKLIVNYFKASNLPASQQQKKINYPYFSPQIICSQGLDSQKNDIWAIGCITLQFLSNTSVRMHKLHPYNTILQKIREEEHYQDLKEKLKMYSGSIINDKNSDKDIISKEAQDFIVKCFELDHQKRPNASYLLSHPFLKE